MTGEWTPLDVDFFSNEKADEVSDHAVLLYLAGLCYCQRKLTDGYITRPAMRRFAAEARTPEPRKADRLASELEDAGLWDATEGGWAVHDWWKWNKPAQVVAEEREQRSEAGLKANHTRWHEGRGITVLGCPWCHSRPDSEPESESESRSESEGESA